MESIKLSQKFHRRIPQIESELRGEGTMLAKFKGKQIVFHFTKNLSEIEIHTLHFLNVEDL